MHVSRWRTVGILWLLAAVTVTARAAEPVTNTLTVHRIEVHANGTETAEPAASAKPGDRLEYIAEFHNTGVSTVRGLSATLPLPPGTELIAASQRPAGASASIDGVTFEPMPLKHTVKQPDGSLREELVPLGDYRFLRWPATELPGGATFSVSARVGISAAEKAQVAAR